MEGFLNWRQMICVETQMRHLWGKSQGDGCVGPVRHSCPVLGGLWSAPTTPGKKRGSGKLDEIVLRWPSSPQGRSAASIWVFWLFSVIRSLASICVDRYRERTLPALLWLCNPVIDPSCHKTALVATYNHPVLCYHPSSATRPWMEKKAALP